VSTRVAASAAVLAGLGLALGQPVAAPSGQVVRIEHRDPSTAPSRGPLNALVTIELFFTPAPGPSNIRLPAAFKALEKLQANHPARIRLVFRVVKSNAAAQLPIAVLEAHAQGKFFELMDKLHVQRTHLTNPQILELARSVGMDVPRLSAAISEGRYADVIAANGRRFDRLHGGAVPNVFFNSKTPRTTITQLTEAEYEREYLAAYDRAIALIDQGYQPAELMRVFDSQALRTDQPVVISTGSMDEDLESDPTDHRLASPPLDLEGLPTFGRPDTAALPVVVMCRPNDGSCANSLRIARQVQEIYTDDVRVVWAPFFDVTREDAAELAMLGDAALCAEQVGSSPDDLAASPGWRWITKQLERAGNSRRQGAERLIDNVSRDLDVDTQRLSACRARMANATLDWIAKARRSGVTRPPAMVIGGRIYAGISADKTTLQRLIEAELAPGVLGGTTESQFDRLLFFLATPPGGPPPAK
jgi:hypothetical protein